MTLKMDKYTSANLSNKSKQIDHNVKRPSGTCRATIKDASFVPLVPRRRGETA